MRHDTGIVIPVYFPEGVDSSQGKALLRDTAWSFCQQVAEPENICLSVDGEHCGVEIAKEIASQKDIILSCVKCFR